MRLPIQLFILMLSAGVAWATSSVVLQVCSAPDRDPDTIIKACTSAIESGELGEGFGLVFYSRGNAYERKGDYERAIQDYDEAIRRERKYAPAYYNRGNAYQGKGDYERAIQDYDVAIRLKPQDALAFNNRGSAYMRKGDYARAIQDYDQAVRLDPNYPPAFNNRGSAYMRKGDYDRAIQDYDQAVRLNSNYSLAFRNRGVTQFYRGEFAAAEADFSKVLLLGSQEAYYLVWLYLAQSRGGNNQARDHLAGGARAFDLDDWPGPIISMYLGRIRPQEAMEAAVGKNPMKETEMQCQVYFHIGQLLLMEGRKNEAVQTFKAAIATGASASYEYNGAKAELKRMGY
jgi:lipoprotein NlpI